MIDAEVFEGSSGSPVFIGWDNKYRLLGVLARSVERTEQLDGRKMSIVVKEHMGLGIYRKTATCKRTHRLYNQDDSDEERKESKAENSPLPSMKVECETSRTAGRGLSSIDIFPSRSSGVQTNGLGERRPNLNPAFIAEMEKRLCLRFRSAGFQPALRGSEHVTPYGCLSETSCRQPRALSLPQPTLGTLWTVGTGSVGTAILYFLSLATQNFSSGVFDMDTVKIHNLDRSPLFTADDVQKKKVVVTERYLNQAGIKTIQAEPHALDESELWRSRDQGDTRCSDRGSQ